MQALPRRHPSRRRRQHHRPRSDAAPSDPTRSRNARPDAPSRWRPIPGSHRPPRPKAAGPQTSGPPKRSGLRVLRRRRASPGSGDRGRHPGPWPICSHPLDQAERPARRCDGGWCRMRPGRRNPASRWPPGGAGAPMSQEAPAAQPRHRGYHGPPVASAGPGSPTMPSAPASRRHAHRTPNPGATLTPGLPGRNGPGPARHAVRSRVPRPVRAAAPTVAGKIHGRPVTGWSGRHRCRSRSFSRLAARPVIRPQAGSPPPGPAVEPSFALSSASALRATPTTCTLGSRSMRRTPMVCRWARRTSRATVRSTPPLDVIA